MPRATAVSAPSPPQARWRRDAPGTRRACSPPAECSSREESKARRRARTSSRSCPRGPRAVGTASVSRRIVPMACVATWRARVEAATAATCRAREVRAAWRRSAIQTSPPCGAGYTCDGVNAACTSCAADAACAPAFYCGINGTCVPRRAQGEACNTQIDCKSPDSPVCTTARASTVCAARAHARVSAKRVMCSSVRAVQSPVVRTGTVRRVRWVFDAATRHRAASLLPLHRQTGLRRHRPHLRPRSRRAMQAAVSSARTRKKENGRWACSR